MFTTYEKLELYLSQKREWAERQERVAETKEYKKFLEGYQAGMIDALGLVRELGEGA